MEKPEKHDYATAGDSGNHQRVQPQWTPTLPACFPEMLFRHRFKLFVGFLLLFPADFKTQGLMGALPGGPENRRCVGFVGCITEHFNFGALAPAYCLMFNPAPVMETKDMSTSHGTYIRLR